MNNPYTKGELRAKMEFRYVGEIRKTGIRRSGYFEAGNPFPTSDTYFVILQDGEGLQMSLWKKNSTYEKAESIQSKIPLCKTVVIEGFVRNRGTHTYFEARTVCWPNGDNVLVWALESDGGQEEESVA